ncbi:MAG TPA: DMT family transporter [Sphingomicrobium sp.]|nr:DMT family transporter [Sphingomicrobium sp.]
MTAEQRAALTTVVIPFVIFTGIWGSTWIVIRDQLGPVPPQWSVAYRFFIAAAAMALAAKIKGHSLRMGRDAVVPILAIGVTQFCINFNSVYLAERHITSGIVATVFALLLIPNSLLGWAFLGQKPTMRFVWSSLFAIGGISLLFVHELRQNPARSDAIIVGIGLTLVGMVAASSANILQARERVRSHPLTPLLAWSMLVGAVIDAALAFALTGPPVFEQRVGYWLGLLYLALFASALAFSLYFPVVRRIGPAKAAYSSAIVPIIAMGFSTWIEGFRWTPLTIAGAMLAIGGMIAALSGTRTVVASPDAA